MDLKVSMKTLPFILLWCYLLCLPLKGAEKDTARITGRFYLDGDPITILIHQGIIVGIDRRYTPGNPLIFVAPGMVDLQINGYMGIDFSSQSLTREDMQLATRALWKEGVTTFLPTVITNHRDSLMKSFALLADVLADHGLKLSIPGFHLEGPYISPLPGYRGAHLEKYIRPPDWAEFSSLQEAAANGIRLITLAPEVPGALAFIRKCTEAGVVVSLGHHNGSSVIIRQAVDAGASLSTHLGNGCANMIHRHDNPLWPQLAEDRLSATLIADGFHLTRDEVLCFSRMKGVERLLLVSDALDLAGLPPGEYLRGERKILLTPEVATYPAEQVLAGAASSLRTAVSNMMRFTGCSLADAIQMASTNPAKMIGLNDRGEIGPGRRADLILFTIEEGSIMIQETFVAGKTVYRKE